MLVDVYKGCFTEVRFIPVCLWWNKLIS